MPPFVYRSLKDFMRASATAKTRQELLQKLITNAAKRKTQTHLDATGARMSTFPEMFGRSLAADMGKQAFLGAGLKMVGRGISNFARNQLSGGLGKFVGNIGNGVRGLGTQTQRAGLRLGNAAQPLVNEVKDMSNQVINRGLEQVDRLPPWALPAAGGAVIGGRVADEINDANELRRPSPLLQNKPQRQQGGLMANPIQETYSMNMGKQSMNKQANPLTQMLSPALKNLRGKVVPELLTRLQILAGKGVRGVKRYGQRLTGDDTLKPLYGRQDEMRALEQQLRQQAGKKIDLSALTQKDKMLDELQQALVGSARRLPDRPYMPGDVFDYTARGALRAGEIKLPETYQAVLAELSKQRPARMQPRRFQSRTGLGRAESRMYRDAARDATARIGAQAKTYDNIFDSIRSQFGEISPQLNAGRAHNAQHDAIWRDQLPNVFRSQHRASKAIRKERDAIESARTYTAGGAVGATLGSVGYGAYANSGNPAMKQSMTMPQPTSRGTMKKVQMPEASSTKPDCDPEGVQMNAQDHTASKQAGLGAILKTLAKGAYKTPRSLKGLTLGGVGGYATGRQHGHQVGLEDGHEDAAKTVINLFHKKQAFMGIGGLAGMATAPEGEEDLSIGRGALRGVGTGLGASTGAVTGGLAGGLGGAGLGAILGALARSSGNRYMSPGLGASQIAPLGMLAGGLGGAVYGGYKGNKATKALLDKTAPIGEKKKDKKDNKEDDKEVKEAAAVVLAQLKRNHNK